MCKKQLITKEVDFESLEMATEMIEPILSEKRFFKSKIFGQQFEWLKCQRRMQKIREEVGLGFERTITKKDLARAKRRNPKT